MGCHAHLQGIFPTQKSNPDLPHFRRILYRLSHQALADGFFTTNTTREAFCMTLCVCVCGCVGVCVRMWKRACALSPSVVTDSLQPYNIACQAPLSVRFSRQEYWSGLPFPHPRDLLNKGIIPASPLSPALAGGFFTTSTTWEAPAILMKMQIGGERELPYG